MPTTVPDLTEYDTDTSQTDTFNNESSWANNKGISVSVYPSQINVGSIGDSTPNYPISIVNNSRIRAITIQELLIVGSMKIVAVNGITSDGSGIYTVLPKETMTVTIEVTPNISGVISGGLYVNTLDAGGSEFVKVFGVSDGIDSQIKLLNDIIKQYQAEGYNVVGNFLEGCVVQSSDDWILNSDYKLWSYTGSELFPYTIDAGTEPSTPNYTLIEIASAYNSQWLLGKSVGYGLDDFNGAKLALYSQAGIEDNDLPNTETDSQIVEALHNLFDTYGTVATLAAGKHPVGTRVALTDRSFGIFLVQAGGTPNGKWILDAGNGNTAIIQDTDGLITKFGAVAGTDVTAAAQAAADACGVCLFPENTELEPFIIDSIVTTRKTAFKSQGVSFVKGLVPSVLNSPIFYLKHDFSSYDWNLKIDGNNTSRDGVRVSANDVTAYVDGKNWSADISADVNTSALHLVTGDRFFGGYRAVKCANTGQSNESTPRALTADSTFGNDVTFEFAIMLDSVDDNAGGSVFHFTNAKIFNMVAVNVGDNFVYNLGSKLSIDNVLSEDIEEGIVNVSSSSRVAVGKWTHRGSASYLVGLESAGLVDISSLVLQQSTNPSSSNEVQGIARTRTGNGSSNRLIIGSIQGTIKPNHLFLFNVGTVRYFGCKDVTLDLNYNEATMPDVAQLVVMTNVNSYDISNWDVSIFAETSMAGKTFEHRLPSAVTAESSWKNIDYKFKSAAGSLTLDGALRVIGAAVQNVKVTNLNYITHVGPYGFFASPVKHSGNAINQIPVAGYWTAGQDYKLSAALVAPFNARCTVSGTPGTWVSY